MSDFTVQRRGLRLKVCGMFLMAGLLSACSGPSTQPQAPVGGAEVDAQEVALDEPSSNNPRDPWEGWNRGVFTFNDTLDSYITKPVAKGYRYITPQPVRTGVTNFFANLGEVSNLMNNLLQGKPLDALKDTGRFLVNSTVGLVGLFDVATPLGMPRSEEDFGQTLAVWGVPQGPYVVWPFLGGRTLTDTAGLIPDTYVNPMYQVEMDDDIRWKLFSLNLIQTREGLLDSEQLIQGDRYTFIRDTYLQRRDFLIQDGRIEHDPFADDGADFDYDEDDFAD